jgi:hypothetical protein
MPLTNLRSQGEVTLPLDVLRNSSKSWFMFGRRGQTADWNSSYAHGLRAVAPVHDTVDCARIPPLASCAAQDRECQIAPAHQAPKQYRRQVSARLREFTL